ncbi:MAG TPA: DUF488 domain-containing protein [Bacteroidales bacterium]|nr:DUF488 domain-containing protein [Bacteroidales bacterium]
MTIYTIGHSTRSIEDFIECLKSFQIGYLVDIRSLPGSRKHPHFNRENLQVSLQQAGIRYLHFPALGGRRKVKPDSKNTGWRLDAFRGYADYMEGSEFKEAIKDLEDLALRETTAYMCAESVWWRCHRSLVSDYLKLKGWKVIHIMDRSHSMEHTYTKPAVVKEGVLSYPGSDDSKQSLFLDV